MAKGGSSIDKLKDLWDSQVNDEQQWAFNSKLLTATGLFVGSIFFMCNFGELMSI